MKRILLFALVAFVLAETFCIVLQPMDADIPAPKNSLPEPLSARSPLSEPLAARLDLLDLVPRNALLMVDAAAPADVGNAFLSSRFGQALMAIRWPSVLDQLKLAPQFRLPLERHAASLSTLLANPLVKELCRRRLVAVLLPSSAPIQRDKLAQSLLGQAVLLVEPSPEDSMTALFSLLAGELQQREKLRHREADILAFDLQPGQVLHAADVGGHLALALDPQPIQQSLDFLAWADGRRNGLRLNKDYAETKLLAQGRDSFFLHANLRGLKSWFGIMDKDGHAGARSMEFFHGKDPGQASRFTAIVRFSPERLHPLQRKFYTAEPVRNVLLHKMPASLLLYFWSSCLEPSAIIESIASSVGAMPAGEQAGGAAEAAESKAEAWLRSKSGLGLREFLALFGREFSVNVADISTAGFFPVPRLCFGIQVRDKAAEQVLDKMASGLTVKRDAVAGSTVVSLMAAKGMMQPSYAFSDDLLLMADSREQIEDILAGTSERMVQSKTFQAVDAGMDQPSNFVFFARVASLVGGMKELVSWAGTMIAVQNEELGEKSKVLVDQVVSPLLDGLSMYEAVGARSHVRPGELVVEASVLHAADDAAAEP